MCSGAAPAGATNLFFMVQEEGRLAYGLCSSGVPIADAAPELAKLGPASAETAEQSLIAHRLLEWLRVTLKFFGHFLLSASVTDLHSASPLCATH
jgi:hypothetical protein